VQRARVRRDGRGHGDRGRDRRNSNDPVPHGTSLTKNRRVADSSIANPRAIAIGNKGFA